MTFFVVYHIINAIQCSCPTPQQTYCGSWIVVTFFVAYRIQNICSDPQNIMCIVDRGDLFAVALDGFAELLDKHGKALVTICKTAKHTYRHDRDHAQKWIVVVEPGDANKAAKNNDRFVHLQLSYRSC